MRLLALKVCLCLGALMLCSPALALPADLATAPAQLPGPIAAALADSARPKNDSERDVLRKPGELLVFAGLTPGAKVADLFPGGGYFTRLFSRVVGPSGHVYALVPSNTERLSDQFRQILAKNTEAMQALVSAGYSNLTPLSQPLNAIAVPEGLDLVWTSQNYHDIFGYWGEAETAAANAAIFKALRPGGVYLVLDHRGKPGAGAEVATSLHRIDPELVKKQVTAAGFVLEAESSLLANPEDDHSLSVFDSKLRGHTDQFVLKFRKPGL